MNITIRSETPSDFSATENLTREAFYNQYGPGCDEHYLLHVMHESDVMIPDLSLVAEYEGKIVGHAVLTRAVVRAETGTETQVLCLGPICVLPEYQQRGIGGRLIREGAARAKIMGWRAILLYGNPEYYSRKGFVPAETYGICTPDRMYAASLQAMELFAGALTGVRGRLYESEIFDVDAEKAAAFDAQFPPKEKLTDMPSQLRFQEIVKLRRPVG